MMKRNKIAMRSQTHIVYNTGDIYSYSFSFRESEPESQKNTES